MGVSQLTARIRWRTQFVLLSRSDGFALGGVIAYLFDDREWVAARISRLRAGFWLAGLGSMGALAWFIVLSPATLRRWGDPYAGSALIGSFTFAYFSLVGLILCDPGHRLLAPLRAGWLCYLGRISYGLYLGHGIIQIIADNVAQGLGVHYPAWLQASIFAASIAAAALSWRFLELPILSWKDRFPYREDREVGLVPDLAPNRAS